MNSDEIEIFYHAHMIFCSIALIQRFQPFTRKSVTLKTKAYLSFYKQLAHIPHMGAVLSSWNTALTIGLMKSFFV